jgi:hypothetical protein
MACADAPRAAGPGAADLLIWRKRASALFALDERRTQRMLAWAGMQPAFNCKGFDYMTSLTAYNLWCAVFIAGCLWIAWAAARQRERLRRMRARCARAPEHACQRPEDGGSGAARGSRPQLPADAPAALRTQVRTARALWQGKE